MELFKRLLDATLVRLLRYLKDRVSPPEDAADDVYKMVQRHAVQSSAEFVEQHLDGALLFPRRERLWEYVASQKFGDGLCAEFGVNAAWSLNFIARLLNRQGRTIYGFDSFEGLKEDWRGTHFAKGDFDRRGVLPKVESNVVLVKGWFDAVLPTFLAANVAGFAFVHFDADTYETTQLVLSLIGERIRAGTILLFDEYLGFPNWQNGEFRAWREFAEQHGVSFRYLAFGPTQAALRVE